MPKWVLVESLTVSLHSGTSSLHSVPKSSLTSSSPNSCKHTSSGCIEPYPKHSSGAQVHVFLDVNLSSAQNVSTNIARSDWTPNHSLHKMNYFTRIEPNVCKSLEVNFPTLICSRGQHQNSKSPMSHQSVRMRWGKSRKYVRNWGKINEISNFLTK